MNNVDFLRITIFDRELQSISLRLNNDVVVPQHKQQIFPKSNFSVSNTEKLLIVKEYLEEQITKLEENLS